MKRYLDEVGKYLDVSYVYDDLAIGLNTLISIEIFRKILTPYLL